MEVATGNAEASPTALSRRSLASSGPNQAASRANRQNQDKDPHNKQKIQGDVSPRAFAVASEGGLQTPPQEGSGQCLETETDANCCEQNLLEPTLRRNLNPFVAPLGPHPRVTALSLWNALFCGCGVMEATPSHIVFFPKSLAE
jgi:hypothetical protein